MFAFIYLELVRKFMGDSVILFKWIEDDEKDTKILMSSIVINSTNFCKKVKILRERL